MKKSEDTWYLDLLRRELVPALGCTEPIAVAYASAKAAQVLGRFPEHAELWCSGNIIKNVKGVKVPNSGGLKGIDAAAVLGIVGGNAELELNVLENVRPEDVARTRELLKSDFFSCKLIENVENLYIIAKVTAGEHSASVTIIERHTLITEIIKDGKILYQAERKPQMNSKGETWNLSVRNILNFVNHVNAEELRPILEPQIQMNTAISQAGLTQKYGTQVGQTMLKTLPNDVRTRACAKAAAGSDARMGGCSLPVIINSGSGNQGMTVSLPVIEYAKEWAVTEECLLKALALSNLIAIHLKHYIGSLSAFCGAVTASAGAGAALTYMAGGTSEQIAYTVVNTLGNIGGIVCDGAKSSCAAKISSSVNAAVLAHHMSMNNQVFQAGEGLVLEDIEATIRSIGYVGRVGMKTTDTEILNIMIHAVTP